MASEAEMQNRTHKGFGLLFEMGCGKTLTAIATMGIMYQEKKIDRVLVIAPTSVVSVWPKDLEEHAAFPYTVSVLLGEKRQRIKMLDDLMRYPYKKLKVAVINYESSWREGIIEKIEDYDPDLIICDESQRIKGYKSKQSEGAHRLGDKAKYKMILSGTPLQNNVTDLWSQYRFLDKSIFGELYHPFERRYCIMHSVFKSKVIKNINMDELRAKEHSIALRKTKAECLDLPEQVFETRYVSMSKKERAMYEQLQKDAVAELENGDTVTAATVLTKMLRLQQFTGGFLVADDQEEPQQISTAKLDALSEIIEDVCLDSGKKLVVFARFVVEVEAIKALAEKCLKTEKSGLKYVSIQGSVKKEDRGSLIKQFQEDPNTMVFVGQIDTAGVGITLTAADTAIYYSKTWNYATYEQSLSRIHRIGQRNTCTYIDLVCEKSIDSKITEALKRKQDLATNIVDNWKDIFKG